MRTLFSAISVLCITAISAAKQFEVSKLVHNGKILENPTGKYLVEVEKDGDVLDLLFGVSKLTCRIGFKGFEIEPIGSIIVTQPVAPPTPFDALFVDATCLGKKVNFLSADELEFINDETGVSATLHRV